MSCVTGKVGEVSKVLKVPKVSKVSEEWKSLDFWRLHGKDR